MCRAGAEGDGIEEPIRFEPLPQDDPKQRRPDITKAKRLLGWEPKIDLEAGLKLSLDYFKQAIQLEQAEKEAGGGGVKNRVI